MRVEREFSYASEMLHSHTASRLSSADHGLATELVMGVLRWRSRLDSEIAESSDQPLRKLDLEILTALRLALYQLRWLTRIPARAAIHESVELVKRAHKHSAAGFVNAVLRKLAGTSSSASQSAKGLPGQGTIAVIAHETAHPPWMVERWARQYGIETARLVCEYNQVVPATAVRLRSNQAEEELRAEGIDLAPGALLASARRIQQGDVTKTRAFRAGRCVIQDEASQLVAALVGSGSRILDCCAAPGGKTRALADRSPGGKITAIDLHPHRARLLRTLVGTGSLSATTPSPNIRVIAADARSLPISGTFDRVLADVPCSGTGTLGRNPEIKWRLRPEDLPDLQSRQVAILRSAMERVDSGGRLIYSTCSLEKEENEDVVERELAENASFRLVNCRQELDRLRAEGELIWPDSASLTSGRYLRTLPGVHPCDGFWAAILEKI